MTKQPDQAPSVPARPLESAPAGLTRRSLVLALAASVALGGVTACGAPGNDRWVVTENTTVDIDWNAINQAYRDAEGPEDFEQKVNEIYTGDEIISISVRDLDDRAQVVTGFFDKDGDGKVSDSEKVFTIQRDLVGADKAQYQISGYGPYHGYHSPMWDIASGMMMGMFLSNMFSPGYRPIYVTPYTTSPARQAALSQHRSSYRAANPGKFAKSSSGRSYGNRGGAWGSGGGAGRRRSGGSFGVRRPAGRRVVGLV